MALALRTARRALARHQALRGLTSLADSLGEEGASSSNAAALSPTSSTSASLAKGGQALPGLHALLAPGDLTPGIPAREYARRREALLAALPPGAVALLAAPPRLSMSGVIPFPYRPASDLFYLSGLTQPGVVALLSASSYTLFVPDPDAGAAVWDGATLSVSEAVDCFGASTAAPLSSLGPALSAAVASASLIFTDDPAAWSGRAAPGGPPSLSHATGVALVPSRLISACPPAAAALSAAASAGRVRPLSPAIAALRVVKSPAELALLRHSAALATAGLRAAAAATGPGVPEWVLAAEFEATTRSAGAARPAYPPVVASGPDACTIHYSRADKRLEKGGLLLMDAGCEWHGAASDVTRTWPVDGAFSAAAGDLYDAVAAVHASCIASVVPGASLRSLHASAALALADAALQLGAVAPGPSPAALVASRAHSLFYPHATGHFLGLDTHDTPAVGVDGPLEAGCVLTVEPGLYFPPEGWWGSGVRPGPNAAALAGLTVRIEDDVAVRGAGQGPEVLSHGFPVGRKEVERLVGEAGAVAADAAAVAAGARLRRWGGKK